MITIIKSFFDGFFHGPTSHRRVMRTDRKVRNNLDDGQVDNMVEETFPASDPPSTY